MWAILYQSSPFSSSHLCSNWGQLKILSICKEVRWRIPSGSDVRLGQFSITIFRSDVRLPIHSGKVKKLWHSETSSIWRVVTCWRYAGRDSSFEIPVKTKFWRHVDVGRWHSVSLLNWSTNSQRPIFKLLREGRYCINRDRDVSLGHPQMTNLSREIKFCGHSSGTDSMSWMFSKANQCNPERRRRRRRMKPLPYSSSSPLASSWHFSK